MEEDNVSPNDSTYWRPKEPNQQVSSRKKEKGEVLAAQKEIKKVVMHFEDRIRYRDSIEALKVDAREDPALHQKKCEVNDMLRLALEEEKRLLEELLDTYDITK